MPWDAAGTQHVGEPLIHPGAEVLTVAQAVVLEGDIRVVGEEVQRAGGHGVGDLLDARAGSAAIALVPDGGRHGVRIAEEHGTTLPRRLVLAPILLPGDLDE